MLRKYKSKASILITKPGLKITSVTNTQKQAEWWLPVPGSREKRGVPGQQA